MFDLSTIAAQTAHYAAVRQRLGMGGPAGIIPRESALLLLPPPEPAPKRPYEFLMLADTEYEAAIYTRSLFWRQIIAEVCAKHSVGVAQLVGNQRNRQVSAARQEAMYRMRTETTMSYPQIARRLGRADHSTVMHGIKRHLERVAQA